MNPILKLLFPGLSLFADGDVGGGGGSGDNPPASGDNPPASGSTTPPAPDINTIISKAVQEAVAPFQQQLQEMQSRFSTTPPANQGVSSSNEGKDPIDAEIELRKNQLAAIRAGQIDARFEPEVQAKLSEAQARKVGREMVQSENQRNEFLGQWNQYLSQAYEEFPDLKDKNSDLFKEAKRIVEEDPAYKAYVKLVKGNARNVDFSLIDARVNLRAAREAFAIIQARKNGQPDPKAKDPNLAKQVLEGKSGVIVPPNDLADAERKAVESGDPNDWLRYINLRDRSLKARQAQKVS